MQIQIQKPVKRHTQPQIQVQMFISVPPPELLRIAFHEAGHAVIAWKEEIPLRNTSVADDDSREGLFYKSLLAKSRRAAGCTNADRLKAERHARICLAGHLA